MTDNSEVLGCDKLEVGHGGQALLPPVDLKISRGEFWAVVGRNGTGKSTWLKTVLGLMPPVAGRVIGLSAKRPRLTYLAQRAGVDSLYPLSVRDAVAVGGDRGWSFLRRSCGARRVDRALEWMGLTSLQHQSFRHLSEGQRQRVLFARIAASEAEVAFLDEPTSALDAKAEREAFALMRRLTRERGMAVVVVTHSLALAAEVTDRALLFAQDPPAVAVGTPAQIVEGLS